MRIGITFDLKRCEPAGGFPDDWQEEFDSPQTIQAIAAALRQLGHEPILLGDGRPLIERLLKDPPDCVFNFAEGEGVSRCREARVPALLEMLGIPYTGSDPLCLAATLDKEIARRLVVDYGVTVAPGFVVPPAPQQHVAPSPLCQEFQCPANPTVTRPGLPWASGYTAFAANGGFSPADSGALQRLLEAHGLTFPLIVKPAWEGSSKGVRQTSVVHHLSALQQAIEQVHSLYHQPALVEQYIAGDELTVGIIGNSPPRILGIMRVIPREPSDCFIYSVEVKRDYRRRVRYESPPQLAAEVLRRVEEAAMRAYVALGCRDVCRLDFRLRQDVPYFLEANPLPGLNPDDSDLVILARLNGWSYTELIKAILESALQRWGGSAGVGSRMVEETQSASEVR